MEWQRLSSFDLSEDWQCTDFINSNVFRLTHAVTNPYSYKLNALVALINFNEGSSTTEIFKPQRISPLIESEIIQFPEPPKGWQHRLAIKQLVNPRDTLINWEVQIDMPLYPINSNDPNPVASTTFTSNTYAVTSSAALKIASANPFRKELTIYNSDTKNTLYVDLLNTVSTTAAAFVIPPGQVYISDIDWLGEVWAIAKGGTINIVVREFT